MRVAAVWRASWKVNPESPARVRHRRNIASRVCALIPNTVAESHPRMESMSLRDISLAQKYYKTPMVPPLGIEY